MASPQREAGYTGIANELLEALAGASLSGAEYRIVLAVLRETYGRRDEEGRWRKEAPLTGADFARVTGMNRNSANKIVSRLVRKGILRLDRSNARRQLIGIQKDWERWLKSGFELTPSLASSPPELTPSSASSVHRNMTPYRASTLTPHRASSDRPTPYTDRKKAKKEAAGGSQVSTRSESARARADGNAGRRHDAEQQKMEGERGEPEWLKKIRTKFGDVVVDKALTRAQANCRATSPAGRRAYIQAAARGIADDNDRAAIPSPPGPSDEELKRRDAEFHAEQAKRRRAIRAGIGY